MLRRCWAAQSRWSWGPQRHTPSALAGRAGSNQLAAQTQARRYAQTNVTVRANASRYQEDHAQRMCAQRMCKIFRQFPRPEQPVSVAACSQIWLTCSAAVSATSPCAPPCTRQGPSGTAPRSASEVVIAGADARAMAPLRLGMAGGRFDLRRVASVSTATSVLL